MDFENVGTSVAAPFLAPLSGIVVTFTGLSKEKRQELIGLLHEMGAQSMAAMNCKVTHLIAERCDPESEKYKEARRRKLPVLLPSWVFAANSMDRRLKDTLNVITSEKHLDTHKTPLFAGCEVTVSGFPGADRVDIGRLVELHGGVFTGQMSRSSCTHLIAATNSGEKFRKAREWGTVWVVTSRWLRKCIETGYRLSESRFAHSHDEDKQQRVSPTARERECTGGAEPDRGSAARDFIVLFSSLDLPLIESQKGIVWCFVLFRCLQFFAMDAGFYRGTSSEQDIRFTDKERKLLRQMKFENVLETKVDLAKINLDVIKPWITLKLNEILGMEDDVVVEYVFTQLEEKELNPKKMQINLTGFLNARRAREFMAEMWQMFVEAQDSPEGIPTSLVEKKVQELKASNSNKQPMQTYHKATEVDWNQRYQTLTGGRYGKMDPKAQVEEEDPQRRRRDPEDDRDERAERRMKYEEGRFKERKDLLREKQRHEEKRRERTSSPESPPSIRRFSESGKSGEEKKAAVGGGLTSKSQLKGRQNGDDEKEKRKKNKKEKSHKRHRSDSDSGDERGKKKKHKKEKKSKKHKERD
ncbi:hypothetical protein niasHS_017413 [Heterodera schachtii]|uniref:Uncharacterized protein n=1 Tax=Heterodera schachtii TaxID=97005 RepID=A0ABD2HVL4_HETSC